MMLGLGVTGLQAGMPLASILGLGVTILGLDSLRIDRSSSEAHTRFGSTVPGSCGLGSRPCSCRKATCRLLAHVFEFKCSDLNLSG